jgi:hypothetical protein
MFLPKRNALETNGCADQRLPRSHSGLVLAGMRNLVALFLVLWFWMAPSHAGLAGRQLRPCSSRIWSLP